MMSGPGRAGQRSCLRNRRLPRPRGIDPSLPLKAVSMPPAAWSERVARGAGSVACCCSFSTCNYPRGHIKIQEVISTRH